MKRKFEFQTLIVLIISTALGLAVVSADEGEVLWRFDTQGEIFGAPALDLSGNLYFGNRLGELISLDGDGNERWTFEAGDWIDSSPTLSLDEKTVYVGSWDNYLYAVSTDTGELDWSFETGNLVISSPALDEEGNLYFGSSDGFFYSVDPTGELRWFYWIGEELDSSPAIAQDGSIYVGAYDGLLYAFSSEGELKWSYETASTEDEADQRIKSPPVIDYYGNVYFGAGNGSVYALDSEGELLWEFGTLGKVDMGISFREDGSLVFGSRDGFLYCVDENGIQLWRSYVGDIFYSSPLVDNFGRTFVGAYIGNGVSSLSAVDADGDIVWEYLILDYIDSSPILDEDGRLYFGSYDGSFYALESEGVLADSNWPCFGNGPANRSQQISDDPDFVLSEQYEAWLSELGLWGSAGDPESDQDGDGFSLLEEYFFGGDPFEVDGELFATELSNDGFLDLEFARVKGEEGYLMEWLFSSDGSAWTLLTDVGDDLEIELISSDFWGDGQYEKVRARFRLSGQSSLFKSLISPAF